MNTLVLNVETVAKDWNDFDDITQAELIHSATLKQTNKTSKPSQIEKAQAGLGLSPCTGSVVALSIYDLGRKEGVVYYLGNSELGDWQEDGFVFKQRTEETILEEFWDGARHYDSIVTFGGRRFSVPFLLHRSLGHDLTPSLSLLGQRFIVRQTPPYHIDLQDELTFYGVMSRRPSLRMFCNTYGLAGPKRKIDGLQMTSLYKNNELTTIAKHSADKVWSVKEVFLHWRKHLAPEFFRNNT